MLERREPDAEGEALQRLVAEEKAQEKAERLRRENSRPDLWRWAAERQERFDLQQRERRAISHGLTLAEYEDGIRGARLMMHPEQNGH